MPHEHFLEAWKSGPGEKPASWEKWGRNGGVYLGFKVVGGDNQDRPLAGQESEPTLGPEWPVRSTWEPDGTIHRFEGEGSIISFAPPGSGKTRKQLMTNLFRLTDWSAIVPDIKGDMTVATALWRRAHGQEVSIVDPWGYIKQNFPKLYDAHPELFESHGLNVLTGFDPGSDTFNDDMADLAEQLLPRGGESNPYWSLAGQALSTGALSAIRATPVYGAQSSLVEFRDMIGQAPEALAEVCKGLVALFGTDRPEIAACLSEFVAHSAEDRERNSIRRVVQANTRWIDSKAIRADMTKNRPIDFASYKQKPKTCYFVIPPGRLRTHSAWLRLMLTAAVLPMMASTEDSKVPVLLMLDEAGALGNIPVIGGNISQIRQFGLKVWSVFQSLDILQETYPKEWKSFLGTADIKVVMSPQEAETPEYFSKLKGEKLFRHWTTSTSRGTSSQIGFQGGRISQMLLHNLLNQGTSENVSTGETFQKEPRIRVDQIAAMNADEGLIFAKRGMVYKTILPQPHLVDDAREGLAQARALIEGKPFPGLTALKRLSTMAKGAAKPAA